jgi:hypothetical protein
MALVPASIAPSRLVLEIIDSLPQSPSKFMGRNLAIDAAPEVPMP